MSWISIIFNVFVGFSFLLVLCVVCLIVSCFSCFFVLKAALSNSVFEGLRNFLTAPIVPLPPVDHSSSAYLDQSNNSSLGIRALPRGHDSCVPVMPEIRMRCQRWDTAMRQYGESLPESVRHELSSPIWDWRKVKAWGFPHLQIGQW